MSKLLKDVVKETQVITGLSMESLSFHLGKHPTYLKNSIRSKNITNKTTNRIIGELKVIQDKFDGEQTNKCQSTQEQADEFERQLIKVNEDIILITQDRNRYEKNYNELKKETSLVLANLDEANEENRKLEKHCASLKTTLEHRNKSLSEANRKIKVKEIAIESINRGLNNRQDLYNESQQQRKDLEERLNERSAKNRELEHQIVVLQKKIDEDAKIYLDGKIELDKYNLQLQKELAEEKESCDIGEKQIDRQNETIDGLRTVCTELGIDANNWQKTSKIWKLSFIASSLFLVILAMYHAF